MLFICFVGLGCRIFAMYAHKKRQYRITDITALGGLYMEIFCYFFVLSTNSNIG